MRGPNITIFKEDVWPPAAPRPRELRDRALYIVGRVNRVLAIHNSHRVIRHVVVTANRRLSVSLRGDTDGRFTLRMHWAMLDMPDFDAALLMAVQKGSFPQEVQTAFDALRQGLSKDHIYQSSNETRSNARGQYVDLDEVLQTLAAELPFPHTAEGVSIVWGKQSGAPGQRTIRLGSMDERKSLIRIHPVLDSPYTPAMVIDFIVWHELCHYVAPPLSRTSARQSAEHRIHHREFRALEALFPYVAEAEEWIRLNLDALLTGQLTPANMERLSP